MAAPVHFTAAGTTRPACGAGVDGASTTTKPAAVTCATCRQTIETVSVPTPHGRTNR